MTGTLYELIREREPIHEAQKRISGVVTATVVDINDPEDRGRVKVNFPWLCDEGEMQNIQGINEDRERRSDSAWAPVASFMGGPNRGAYFMPEPGDEVLVAFHNGDINRPYVIGAIWHEDAKPPEKMDPDGKNNYRSIVSRSGSILQFDDTEGEEKILLRSAQQGKHYIIIEVTKGNEKIGIIDSQGGNSITLDTAANLITIESSKGSVEVKAPRGTFKIDARHVDIRARSSINIRSSTINVKSYKSTEVASQGPIAMESQSSLEVKAGGVLTIQGNLVKIN
ncbi:MAG: phage baseplate assembly protein V [bacterium]